MLHPRCIQPARQYGIPRLRRAICNWYERRFSVTLGPETEAIVTIGSKEGLAHLMLATLGRGDTALVPNPSYPIHLFGAIIAGADVHSVPNAAGVDVLAEVERAIRLYLRDVVAQLAAGTERIAESLESLAMHQGAVVLPGYTHM